MSRQFKVAVKIIEGNFCGCLAVLAILLPVAIGAPAQTAAPQPVDSFHFGAPVVAVTYDPERAKISALGGGFWMQGGGVDVAVPFYKGLGVAGSFQGSHASNLQPGVSLSKISYLAGPRYTYESAHVQLFGEGLFGGTHGFDGTFPATAGVTSTANSFAMQLGGGLDVALPNGFGLRALELDYVRTALPNNGTNTQNDLRLAFGLSYRFHKK